MTESEKPTLKESLAELQKINQLENEELEIPSRTDRANPFLEN